jgi:NTP pyrophosphatase (non-canonical NTP hydrolase)
VSRIHDWLEERFNDWADKHIPEGDLPTTRELEAFMAGYELAQNQSNTQQQVLQAIARERDRQDAKWGPARQQPDLLWLAVLNEEQGEVAKEVVEASAGKGYLPALRRELIQTAAVCVAWLETLSPEDSDAR